jgi:hypothetical protein
MDDYVFGTEAGLPGPFPIGVNVMAANNEEVQFTEAGPENKEDPE